MKIKVNVKADCTDVWRHTIRCRRANACQNDIFMISCFRVIAKDWNSNRLTLRTTSFWTRPELWQWLSVHANKLPNWICRVEWWFPVPLYFSARTASIGSDTGQSFGDRRPHYICCPGVQLPPARPKSQPSPKTLTPSCVQPSGPDWTTVMSFFM